MFTAETHSGTDVMSWLSLEGRSAWVLGGSRGLGFAAAKAMVSLGANVTIIARGTDDMHKVIDAISDRGHAGRIRRCRYDITLKQDRDELLKTITHPDILVSNMGGPPFGKAIHIDEAQWKASFNEVFISQTSIISALYESMRERKWGRIILVGSAILRTPDPHLAISQVVRSALAGYMAASSREFVKNGVTINAILAGSFATERTISYLEDQALKRKISVDDVRARLVESIPAGRLGNPDEYGILCAFLATDAAAYIAGQQIAIDGGRSTILSC